MVTLIGKRLIKFIIFSHCLLNFKEGLRQFCLTYGVSDLLCSTRQEFGHSLSRGIKNNAHNSERITKDVGTAVSQWLRCSAINRKVAVSTPAGVIEIFLT